LLGDKRLRGIELLQAYSFPDMIWSLNDEFRIVFLGVGNEFCCPAFAMIKVYIPVNRLFDQAALFYDKVKISFPSIGRLKQVTNEA